MLVFVSALALVGEGEPRSLVLERDEEGGCVSGCTIVVGGREVSLLVIVGSMSRPGFFDAFDAIAESLLDTQSSPMLCLRAHSNAAT